MGVVYHVETLFWTGANAADQYRSADSDILASDAYTINESSERNEGNTYLLKTQTAGYFWAVRFHYPTKTHTCWRLTEEEALNLWASMESCSRKADSPSLNIVPFNTAFPGFTITNV